MSSTGSAEVSCTCWTLVLEDATLKRPPWCIDAKINEKTNCSSDKKVQANIPVQGQNVAVDPSMPLSQPTGHKRHFELS